MKRIQQNNRSHQIIETLSMFLPRELQRGETDIPDNLKLTPGSQAGYVADYNNPVYDYGGSWWQATGSVDLDNLPQGITPVFADPTDSHLPAPSWNRGYTPDALNAFPQDVTLKGSRGFVHQSARRGTGSERSYDYNPTGRHLVPRLSR